MALIWLALGVGLLLCLGGVDGPRVGVVSARVISVIEAEILRGKGIDESDPIRRVMQYYNFDGTLLAERDPWKKEEEDVELPNPRPDLRSS